MMSFIDRRPRFRRRCEPAIDVRDIWLTQYFRQVSGRKKAGRGRKYQSDLLGFGFRLDLAGWPCLM
jgi:hypothetical protein